MANPPRPMFRYGQCHAAMYQCSACGHTGPIKTNVQNHVSAKCPGATVIGQRCTLFFRPEGATLDGTSATIQAVGNDVSGDHNTFQQVVVNATASAPAVLPVGCHEERARLYGLFREQPSLQEMFGSGDLADIPARMFALWKGADAPAELHNIRVVGNRVEEHRGPGNVVSVPRTRFVKQTLGDMFQTAANAAAASSADNAVLRQAHEDLTRAEYTCKKARVSALDAARMHAASSRAAYDLDDDARSVIRDSSTRLDRELDHYSREVRPEF